MKKLMLSMWMAGLGGLALWAPARADQINVAINPSFDTTVLQNQGQFELAFLLTDGSGSGDKNTTIGISNFHFGSGGTGGDVTPDSTGGFSGNLLAGASLIDSSFFNLFGAKFTPGNQLSFMVNILSTSLDSPTPDLFQFVILNSSGLPVFTTDPSGQDTLITVNLNSSNPVVQKNSLNTTPEPGSMLLLATGLAIFGVWRCRTGVQVLRSCSGAKKGG